MDYKPEDLKNVLLDKPNLVIQRVATIFGKKIPEEKIESYRDTIVRECLPLSKIPKNKEKLLNACIVTEMARQMRLDDILKEEDIKGTLESRGGFDGIVKATGDVINEAINDYYKELENYYKGYKAWFVLFK